MSFLIRSKILLFVLQAFSKRKLFRSFTIASNQSTFTTFIIYMATITNIFMNKNVLVSKTRYWSWEKPQRPIKTLKSDFIKFGPKAFVTISW